MAGRSISSIKSDLGTANPTIRVMPNLPILIGKGVSLFHREDSVTEEMNSTAQLLFSHSSTVLTVQSEDLIDAGTAVSGSGPGFVFHLLQGAYSKAQELGFNEEQAKTLVSETVLGAVELYRTSSESLETLEKQVTSKGGTTEAGISTLHSEDARHAIEEAIAAAFLRAREL